MASSAPAYTVPVYAGQPRSHPLAYAALAAVAALASALATQMIAARLHYPAAFGTGVTAPLWHGHGVALYPPYAWAVWAFMLYDPGSPVTYPKSAYAALDTLAYVLCGGLVASFVAFGLVDALVRTKQDVRESVDSGRWASREEMQREGFFCEAGPIIGGYCAKRGKVIPVRYDGQKGVEITMPPGEGKTVELKTNLLIPLVRSVRERIAKYGDTPEGRRADFWGYEPSFVALDVKGSLYAATSWFQKHVLGKEIYLFEPLAEFTTGRASCNPLWGIRVGTIFMSGECYQAAYDLTPTGAKDLPTYWDAACTAFGAAVIGTLAFRALASRRYDRLSFAELIEYISTQEPQTVQTVDEHGHVEIQEFDSIEVLARDMQRPHDPHGIFGWTDVDGLPTGVCPWIRSAALGMLNKAREERSGVYGTFLERLGVFRDEVLRQHTSTSSFSFRELANREKPCAVYLKMPAMKLEQYRIFLSIFVRTAIRDITEEAGNLDGEEVRNSLRSTLFILDEIATLGKDPVIASASGYVRGAGGMLIALWQTVQQKLQHYGDHESLTATMGVHTYGRPEQYGEAEKISNELGQFSSLVTTRNLSGSRLGPKNTLSEHAEIRTRNLLTATEVRRLPSDKNIVISRGLTMLLDKFSYYKNASLRGRAKHAPVTESDVMSTTPYFETFLRSRIGEERYERLSEPVPDDTLTGEATILDETLDPLGAWDAVTQ